MSRKKNLLHDLNELAGLNFDAAAAERAIERTKFALTSPPQLLLRAQLMRPRNLAAIAAAIAIIVVLSQLLPMSGGVNFAFGQVKDEVAKTKSVQYTETWSQTAPDGKKYSDIIGHVKILGNRLKREEQELGPGEIRVSLSPFGGRPIEITDLDRQKKATLYPDVKGYLSMDWKGTFAGAYEFPENDVQPQEADQSQAKQSPTKKDTAAGSSKRNKGYATGTATVGQFDWSKAVAAPNVDIFELIRSVPIDKAVRLEEKTIGNKRAIGFLVETKDTGANASHTDHGGKPGTAEESKSLSDSSSSWRHTWWVDPTTKLPLQLEIEFLPKPPAVGGFKRFISDITFNEPLDAKLFSVDVPAGYTDFAPILKADAERSEKEYNQPNRMMSLQFRQTQNMKMKDGRKAPELVKHVTLLDGHLRREQIEIKPTADSQSGLLGEIKPSTILFDAKAKKSLVLLPDRKHSLDPTKTNFTADYLQAALDVSSPLDLLQTGGKVNPYADVNMLNQGCEWLPLTTIDDKLLLGRRTIEKTNRGQFTDIKQRTFWERPGSFNPVRIEETFRSTDPALGDIDIVTTDFVRYAPVDRAKFTFDPPASYTEMPAK